MVLEFILITLALVGLVIFYGDIRYSEGRRQGYLSGVVRSTTDILTFLEKENVIGFTRSGDIYRIDDNGNRDNIVFDAQKVRAQLAMDIEDIVDKFK